MLFLPLFVRWSVCGCVLFLSIVFSESGSKDHVTLSVFFMSFFLAIITLLMRVLCCVRRGYYRHLGLVKILWFVQKDEEASFYDYQGNRVATAVFYVRITSF